MRDFEPSFRNIKECQLNYKTLNRLQSKKLGKPNYIFQPLMLHSIRERNITQYLAEG